MKNNNNYSILHSSKNSSKLEHKGLTFIPIGGVGEIGGNCYAYGLQDQWIIVDYGIAFPNNALFGGGIELPDLSFFIDKQDKILAIIITHAHEDHIGGLAYMWNNLHVPVYATRFAATFLRHKLKDNCDTKNIFIRKISDNIEYQIGPFILRAISMGHSIPEAILLVLDTVQGLIVHTGDWNRQDNFESEKNRMIALQTLATKGVDYLISESTNIMSSNPSQDCMTESEVYQNLKMVIKKCSGRVLVTCFASNVVRIENISRAGLDNGRKIALIGRSMWRINAVARELGYFSNIPEFKAVKDLHNIPDKQCLYIVTGSQAEPSAALTRMASQQYSDIHLKSGDTIIYSSREIPGNEKDIAEIHNRLSIMGVKVIKSSQDDMLHASGHASRQSLSELIRQLKPRVFIPIHGESRHLIAHIELANECGVKNSVLVQNGDIVKLEYEHTKIIGQVSINKLITDGNRLIESHSTIVQERKRIASQGIVTIVCLLDKNGKLLTTKISTIGLLEENDEVGYNQLSDALRDVCKVLQTSKQQISLNTQFRSIEKTMLTKCKKFFSKKPWIQVILLESR